VDDHRFTIGRHVTAVPLEGCNEADFWTWCANQALEPMDRSHPLWRVTFATGLTSGRVGVLVVMHHALADGIAGSVLAAGLLDPDPDEVVVSRPWRPLPLALTADAAIMAGCRQGWGAPRPGAG
jgi:diacylglycerol O-acyltransferase / wax synthase